MKHLKGRAICPHCLTEYPDRDDKKEPVYECRSREGSAEEEGR